MIESGRACAGVRVSRVVAQWMWLSSASRRSTGVRTPVSRKWLSSVKVGYSTEQSRRDTAKAPAALAKAQQRSSGSPLR